MLLYAVIDTNVLVSAFLKENSIPRSVINTMYAGTIIPIYNEKIIAEYSTVLHRPKFCFPAKSVDIAVHAIQEIGIKFDGISVNEPMPDPKDIVFYIVTLHARQQFNAYLITGNIKHFPEVPFVITPHQALDISADNFITNQWTYIENSTKLPDMLLFLNGLPIVLDPSAVISSNTTVQKENVKAAQTTNSKATAIKDTVPAQSYTDASLAAETIPKYGSKP
jgi:hypothetical protein